MTYLFGLELTYKNVNLTEVLENLLVAVSKSPLHTIHRLFLNFIWCNKRPRIGRYVLLSPRSRGGLNTPDLIKYYLASHIRQILSWTIRPPSNRWVEIKQLLPIHLSSLLNTAERTSKLVSHTNLLNPMIFTRQIWHECNKTFTFAPSCSHLTNILYHLVMTDSLSYSQMMPWAQADIFQLRHLVNPITHKLIYFKELRRKSPSFTLNPTLTVDRLTDFKHLCMQGPNQPHLISTQYKILQATPLWKKIHTFI